PPACKRPDSARQSVLVMATDRRARRDGLVGMTRRFRVLAVLLTGLIASGAAGPDVALGGDGELALGAEERRQIELGLRELTDRLHALGRVEGRGLVGRRDRLADAEVFARGI